MTTVEIAPGSQRAFEAAIAADRPKLQDETLWYRMVAGGTLPRYLRLRPRSTISVLVEERSDLPEKLISKVTIEILNFRTAMSYLP